MLPPLVYSSTFFLEFCLVYRKFDIFNIYLKLFRQQILRREGRRALRPRFPATSGFLLNRRIEACLESEGKRTDVVDTDKPDNMKEINVIEVQCPSWGYRTDAEDRETMQNTTVGTEIRKRQAGVNVNQKKIVVDILEGYRMRLREQPPSSVKLMSVKLM